MSGTDTDDGDAEGSNAPSDGSTGDQYAAQLSGISKRFGDVVANDGVDLDLERGSVHALLGENGSGKTTLMNVLYGLYEQDEGTVRIDGEVRDFDSPRDAIDAGVGMIHQHFQLVEPMTVLQNVVLGHEPTRGGIVDADAAREDVVQICERYGFDVHEDLDTPVRELDLGAQQHVEIVKSLYRGAEILVLDEPTAVLTPQEVEGLFDVMTELTASGRSLIFITHKLDEAMEAADEITVLRDGAAVGTVSAAATSREELAEMMVGREVIFDAEDRATEPGAPVLTIEDLEVVGDRGLPKVRGVDCTVREGEILGVAGVEGNGQAELAESIVGLRSVADGTVTYEGTDITDASRRSLIQDGIAYIPQDRQSEGLVLDYDLERNALLGNQTIEPFVRRGVIDWDAVGDHAESIVEKYDVEPHDTAAVAESLSGGNQQKFVVGREFEHDPRAIVAAHPTRGVDIGSIEFIHDRLREMRDDGLAVLLVSSKLEEIQQLSDRIAVMYEGEFVDVVEPGAVTEQELGLLMTGTRPGESNADASSADAAARDTDAGSSAADTGGEGQ
ncbi:ABC transporter ATP-binding protein [Salinarchaeum chitinilyticum]